ncbi:MAG: ribonuclease HI [Microbacteriaceae bacterium]|nr:ribonuclease HI [Microbacteriaceae bacterium]
MTIIAAADGSALGNPGPAGWAWYVNDGCWAAGGWKHATNNQGELTAVLEFFRSTAHLSEDVLLLCDSQYVINSVTKWMPGWKKKGWRKSDGKPVLNLELLQEIDEAIVGRNYRFEWVRGHTNHPLNEAADTRARAVSEAYQRGAAIPAGPGWFRSGQTRAALAPIPKPEPNQPEPNQPEPFQPELFSLDAPLELIDVTVALSADVHARLLERAKNRGISVEDALRDLI